MDDQARLTECLDNIQFKCNTYPFRHGLDYCFVVRAGHLLLCRHWHIRPHDTVLYTFQDSEATDIVLNHLDIEIAKRFVRIYNEGRP